MTLNWSKITVQLLFIIFAIHVAKLERKTNLFWLISFAFICIKNSYFANKSNFINPFIYQLDKLIHYLPRTVDEWQKFFTAFIMILFFYFNLLKDSYFNIQLMNKIEINCGEAIFYFILLVFFCILKIFFLCFLKHRTLVYLPNAQRFTVLYIRVQLTTILH